MKNKLQTVNLMLVAVLIIFGCKEKLQPPKERLTYIGAHTISVPEPSGLDMTYNERGFWTVSDETSTVYKLDDEANVVKKFKIDGFDMEAITVVNDTIIAIVLERTREVVLLDTSGNELARKKLNLEGEENSGLEGITYSPKTGHFYLLNEKKPSLLIELNGNLEMIKIDTLKFSKDVSGIYYDERNDILWMLSDENQLVIKTDLNGNLLEKFDITIVQPEGITLDSKGKKLYIVSDNKEKLYIYEVN